MVCATMAQFLGPTCLIRMYCKTDQAYGFTVGQERILNERFSMLHGFVILVRADSLNEILHLLSIGTWDEADDQLG